MGGRKKVAGLSVTIGPREIRNAAPDNRRNGFFILPAPLKTPGRASHCIFHRIFIRLNVTSRRFFTKCGWPIEQCALSGILNFSGGCRICRWDRKYQEGLLPAVLPSTAG